MTNRQVVLARYPEGTPAPADFALRDAPDPVPGEGEALVEVAYLSMDPFPRLRMRADSRVGPPLPLGEVVDGRGLGRVIASHAAGLAPGDWVAGDLGWQARAVLPAAKLQRIERVNGAPQRHLSVLGPSGMTAYFAMLGVGQPRSGDTVVVAPAAGSVGSIAGPLARMHGARVVGVGSGAAQVAQLTTALGFDAGVDAADPAALTAACPDGVDVFLDGVGGALHDAVLPLLRPRARVVLLGFIAGYNDGRSPAYGAAAPILFKRARMEGFLLADWADRFGEAQERLAGWLDDGSLTAVETMWDGLEQAPAAFAALFGDAAPGKQIVRVNGMTGERA